MNLLSEIFPTEVNERFGAIGLTEWDDCDPYMHAMHGSDFCDPCKFSLQVLYYRAMTEGETSGYDMGF